jgi:hypothetical protein
VGLRGGFRLGSHQFAYECASPDTGNQPVAKTHLGQLPGRVESRLPLRVGSSDEITREIEHDWARKQQGHKAGETKRSGKEGFANQQKASAAPK